MVKWIWIALLIFSSATSLAKNEVRAEMAAPRCDAGKLKQLASPVPIKVEKSDKPGIYWVTLDDEKLTFVALVKKMYEAGCF